MKRVTHKILRVLPLFSVLLCGYCPAVEIYVDVRADAGAADGGSWGTAFVHLQDALVVAQAGDEVYVAVGIYYPDTSTANPDGSGDPNAVFALHGGAALRGGYAGLGAADPNERDFDTFESVLCGDFDDNDAIITTRTDLLNDSTRDDNSFYVVAARDVDEATVLDGFTIRGGSSWQGSLSAAGAFCTTAAMRRLSTVPSAATRQPATAEGFMCTAATPTSATSSSM